MTNHTAPTARSDYLEARRNLRFVLTDLSIRGGVDTARLR
jgi:hypothetical protein